ncbi:class I SAM-dependent methyltransferase [Winogradskyella bathintestinalis]|uniref:Class I SAM-dependent methyltransferase n=1 Tax=Winogradskyella bathintestinalis TaxID=3035208 RepID=A0ABT7ZT22_9FLAO|nr:class I SAM-dependent methyltransferase [Winogradskyella bathintestinalis]MDN3492160.1 class I SAM-dependent methyltransferase [Winogradskyella bathintestinalis]
MKKRVKFIVLNLLTNTVGRAMVLLHPKKTAEWTEAGITLILNEDLSFTERLMRNAILSKVEKQSDYNTLADLHKNYWVNQGADFFAATDDSFETSFLPDCSFIFDLLKKELKNQPQEFKTLVEIGTGNGKVLEYLSSEFSKIDRFVGIDLSPSQMKKNSEDYKMNPKLEFVAADGFDWVKEHGQSHTIFVTSRGVLEYFTEERLQAFLNEVSNLGKTMFVAIEPNAIGHNVVTHPESQPYGHERSFSHNYAKLFKYANYSLWYSSTVPCQKSHDLTFIGAKN